MVNALAHEISGSQRWCIAVNDVAAGVQQQHRSRRAHRVQIVPGTACRAGEINRVKTPADQWHIVLVRRQCLAQPLEHGAQITSARPGKAIWIHAVVKAAIDMAPVHALREMRMPFNKPWH